MTASLVPLSAHPNALILKPGTFTPDVTATAMVYKYVVPPGTPGTPVTVYTDATGTTTLSTASSPQPIPVDSNGLLLGYVAAGQDLSIVASQGGVTADPALLVPLRAADLIGTDGKIAGPGSVGVTSSVVSVSSQSSPVLFADAFMSSTSDTAGAQSAVNAASVLGTAAGAPCQLTFTPGKSYTLGQVTPKNNVHVVFTGASVAINPAATQAMFYSNSGTLSNFRIIGGTFVGTGSESTAQAILQVNNPGSCQDVEVWNTNVTNWATGPFYFGNVIRAKAVGNTIVNCCTATGTNAINFVSQLSAGTAQTCIATNNVITGCGAHAIAYVNTGTTSNTECRVVIANNAIECNASNTGVGIDVEFAVASIGEGSKFSITGNVCTYDGAGTNGYAISVNGASGTDASMINRVTVTGNVVDSTTRGILLTGTQISCTGNVVNSAQGAIFVGKFGSNPNLYQVIANNVLHAANTIADTAILNCSQIQHSKITGNLILADSGVASTNPNGIDVANGGWVDVLDNTVIQAPRHGILVGGNDIDIRGNRVYNPSAQAAGFHGIFLNTVTGQFCRVIDNTVVDDRGTHQMTNGVNVSSTSIAEVRGNRISGYLTSAVSGTIATRTDNRLTTGSASGRATLVAGTVTVSTAEIQSSDNVLLTVVSAAGTRGEVQLGTITAGTSFVINSIQPGTTSTLQTSDTSVVYWEIRH